jgi:hypothetical protein
VASNTGGKKCKIQFSENSSEWKIFKEMAAEDGETFTGSSAYPTCS